MNQFCSSLYIKKISQTEAENFINDKTFSTLTSLTEHFSSLLDVALALGLTSAYAGPAAQADSGGSKGTACAALWLHTVLCLIRLAPLHGNHPAAQLGVTNATDLSSLNKSVLSQSCINAAQLTVHVSSRAGWIPSHPGVTASCRWWSQGALPPHITGPRSKSCSEAQEPACLQK